ncbi:hypothetical protein PTKIN_Ptkin16aG0485900 [Pterospermum kingtungense]
MDEPRGCWALRPMGPPMLSTRVQKLVGWEFSNPKIFFKRQVQNELAKRLFPPSVPLLLQRVFLLLLVLVGYPATVSLRSTLERAFALSIHSPIKPTLES